MSYDGLKKAWLDLLNAFLAEYRFRVVGKMKRFIEMRNGSRDQCSTSANMRCFSKDAIGSVLNVLTEIGSESICCRARSSARYAPRRARPS